MTTLETLKAARLRIAKPQNWVREALAVDSRGNQVEPTDQEACRFCMAGALMYAAGGWSKDYDRAVAFMEEKVVDGSISMFNDGHKHKDVLRAFDEAIKKLEAA